MTPPAVLIHTIDRWLGYGVEVAAAVEPDRPWRGRIVVCLPSTETGPWAAKLLRDYAAGGLQAAVVLARAATDAAWFAQLARYPHCFLRGRLRFRGYRGDAPYASVVFYLGSDAAGFAAAFANWGVLERVECPETQNRPSNAPATENDVKNERRGWRRWLRQVWPW